VCEVNYSRFQSCIYCAGNPQEDNVAQFQQLSCKNLSGGLSIKCRRISRRTGKNLSGGLSIKCRRISRRTGKNLSAGLSVECAWSSGAVTVDTRIKGGPENWTSFITPVYDDIER